MKTFDKPLESDKEKDYLERIKAGDKEAKDIFILKNLRLVAHMVKRYNYNEQNLEDLLSIGTIGLIKAINTFDCKKGSRFATYAAKCIDNELLMTFRNDRKKAREVSFDEPFGTDKEGNEISLIDVKYLEDEDVVERLQKKQDLKIVMHLVETVLDERERTICVRRFGLYDNEPATQRELAKELNISRSYVSRIENKALSKLAEGLKKCYNGVY